MLYNTGKERCQILTLDKKVNGVSLSGYPKTYSIRNAFTMNSHSYGLLGTAQFMELSVEDYNSRLADFKDYVSASESNVDIDSVTESGYEAYRDNLTACPFGGV